jgi:hypothetical protein
MIFRTPKFDEPTMLYVVEDTWNTIYTIVVDGYVTKQDFIRRRNVCSMCGRSYPADLKNQTHLHHVRFDPANPAGNTLEVCDDPGDSCHNRLHGGTLKQA